MKPLLTFVVGFVAMAALCLTACGENYRYNPLEDDMRRSLQAQPEALLVPIRGPTDSVGNASLDLALEAVRKSSSRKLFQLDSTRTPSLWKELGGQQGCKFALALNGSFARCLDAP